MTNELFDPATAKAIDESRSKVRAGVPHHTASLEYLGGFAPDGRLAGSDYRGDRGFRNRQTGVEKKSDLGWNQLH
jgi:hypothetical protein